MNPFEITKLLREAVGELKHVCNNIDLIRWRLDQLDGRIARIDRMLPHQEPPTEEPT